MLMRSFKEMTYGMVLLALLMLPVWMQAQVLVPKNSVWKYDDNGNNLGTAWRSTSYNDSGWPSGPGILGFGDGQATGLDWGENCYYFRKTVNIPNGASIQVLKLELLRDDGAVVYINGQEVVRSNMPSGTISHSTNANDIISGSDEDEYNVYQFCNDGYLIDGNNIIAVEIHQDNFLSSDISFDMQLTDISATVPVIVRGPYLQTGTPTSVIVKWRTPAPGLSTVAYGLSATALTDTITSGLGCQTDHEVKLGGLLPNTTYHYRIMHNGVAIAGQTDQYFTTSPNPGTRQLVRAWFLGDAGTKNNNQRNVRDAYYNYVNALPAGQNHTDMVVLLGDNAYDDGKDSEYQDAVFENMYEDMIKKSVLWSTLGNHDGHSADAGAQSGPYFDIFTFPKQGEAGGVPSGTEAYYSYDYGNIHFIVLESNETDRSVGGAMYNWAEADIQNTTADWIVAVWHHPPYTRGSHLSDLELQLFQMRQNFLPMLESNGVDLVLCGHSHSYERSYFLNGHYGLSFSFDANNHTVGATGDGNGKHDVDGEYRKTTQGTNAGKGAVYITAGSSGKTSGGSLDHPAMVTSLNELGSCVMEVSNDTMNVKFLRETGAVDDYFTIIKGGLTAPSVTITSQPNDTTVACGTNMSPAALGMLTATGNCQTPGIKVTYTDSIVAGNCAGNYTLLRQWTAADSCLNTAQATQTITVTDTISPAITCPATDTLYLNASGDVALPDYTSLATATDACSGIATVVQAPAVGSLIIGDTTVTLAATDSCGNTSGCSVSIVTLNYSINISQPPVDTAIYCGNPTDTSVTGVLNASTNCPGGWVSVSFTDVSSGGTCPTITRTWTVTDTCGNTQDHVQTIETADTLAPVLNCSVMNDTIYLLVSDTAWVGSYLSFASATDDCDTAITLSQQPAMGAAVVDTGMTTISIIAEDGCGNQSVCDVAVLVLDTLVSGVSDIDRMLEEVKLYPNPAEDHVVVKKPGTEVLQLTIFHSDGREAISQVLMDKKTTIDISSLAKGMYLVQLQNGLGQRILKLVVW